MRKKSFTEKKNIFSFIFSSIYKPISNNNIFLKLMLHGAHDHMQYLPILQFWPEVNLKRKLYLI